MKQVAELAMLPWNYHLLYNEETRFRCVRMRFVCTHAAYSKLFPHASMQSDIHASDPCIRSWALPVFVHPFVSMHRYVCVHEYLHHILSFCCTNASRALSQHMGSEINEDQSSYFIDCPLTSVTTHCWDICFDHCTSNRRSPVPPPYDQQCTQMGAVIQNCSEPCSECGCTVSG